MGADRTSYRDQKARDRTNALARAKGACYASSRQLSGPEDYFMSPFEMGRSISSFSGSFSVLFFGQSDLRTGFCLFRIFESCGTGLFETRKEEFLTTKRNPLEVQKVNRPVNLGSLEKKFLPLLPLKKKRKIFILFSVKMLSSPLASHSLTQSPMILWSIQEY